MRVTMKQVSDDRSGSYKGCVVKQSVGMGRKTWDISVGPWPLTSVAVPTSQSHGTLDSLLIFFACSLCMTHVFSKQ